MLLKVPIPEPGNMIQRSTSLWERAKIEWSDPGPIVVSPFRAQRRWGERSATFISRAILLLGEEVTMSCPVDMQFNLTRQLQLS